MAEDKWIKFDTQEDENRFVHLIRDIALSAQPDVPDTNVDGNLIDRQAAIDALWKIKDERDSVYYTSAIYTAIDAIEQLPSAQQERKKGKWIYNSPVTMKCNQCGFVIKDWDWHRFKYCPNCIADMRGENDG